MSKTLYIPLSAKLYTAIEQGTCTEVFRPIKPYWIRRIGCELHDSFCHCCIFDYLMCGQVTHVRLTYGISRRTMTFQVRSINICQDNISLGAPTNKRVFIIRLGKRI